MRYLVAEAEWISGNAKEPWYRLLSHRADKGFRSYKDKARVGTEPSKVFSEGWESCVIVNAGERNGQTRGNWEAKTHLMSFWV